MATIVQRPGENGQTSYRAQVRRKGAPSLSATFTKLSDARKWVQVTEAAILEGRHFKTAEAKRHTLADLIDRYRRDILPHKSAASIRKQTQQLLWWKKHLGYSIVADITPALLAEYRDKLEWGESIPRSSATVCLYLAALSHVFTIAVKERQWLDDSPMRKVRKPRKPRGRVRYLSDEERHQLLEACQASRNPYLYIIVMLALATGARMGELLALRWSDVDLKRCTLTFHETKNGERRAVPLTGQALTLMQQYARVRRIDTVLVFPDASGNSGFTNSRSLWFL
jgi:integrase